jgi:hypothetical protein
MNQWEARILRNPLTYEVLTHPSGGMYYAIYYNGEYLGQSVGYSERHAIRGWCYAHASD